MSILRFSVALYGTTLVTTTLSCSILSPTTPSIFISVVPNPMSIAPGTTATAKLLLVRSAAFTGPVVVVAEGLPAGVSADVVTMAASDTTAPMHIGVAATAAQTTADVTVHATGTGVSNSVKLSLAIPALAPANSFAANRDAP
jgi:hypothetical protein